MNWDAVGAIAEAIGAAGVIASLLYLAVQVRGAGCRAWWGKLGSHMFGDDFVSFIDSEIRGVDAS